MEKPDWLDEVVARGVVQASNRAIEVCANLVEEWPHQFGTQLRLAAAIRMLIHDDDSARASAMCGAVPEGETK